MCGREGVDMGPTAKYLESLRKNTSPGGGGRSRGRSVPGVTRGWEGDDERAALFLGHATTLAGRTKRPRQRRIGF